METKLTLPDGREVTVRLREPEAYYPNPDNSNRGKERGKAALDESLQSSGFHRGIVVASDGTVVNGNHAYQSASELGVVKGWVEIEVNGDLGVVTKRIDWKDASDPQAILAAIADNRVSELNFDIDPEILTSIAEEIEIPSVLYTSGEIEALLIEAISANTGNIEEEEEAEFEDKLDSDRYPLAIVLDWSTHKRWETLKEEFGVQSDTKAFLKLLDALKA